MSHLVGGNTRATGNIITGSLLKLYSLLQILQPAHEKQELVHQGLEMHQEHAFRAV